MDQVIMTARELGKALQADGRYIRYNTAQQKNDEDAELQKMIGEFSEKRERLQEEVKKEPRDAALVSDLNAEVSELYGRIFQTESMIEFARAREEFQKLVTYINQIITGSTSGLDPDAIEFQQDCGGSCSSCAGCG